MGKTFDIAKFAASLEKPPADSERNIETITAEIVQLKQDAGNAILAIGDRLIEAKGKLSHGEWLTWLTEQVDFSERTAQNFMRLAREWSNPQALADLGATKALTLLALPPEERVAFISEAHFVDGGKKAVVDMTSRELEKAIRERDEARKAMEAAQADARASEESRAKMESDMAALKALQEAAQRDAEQAQADLRTAREELQALREKPVDVAVETVPDPEAVRQAREEAIKEMQAKVDAAEAKVKASDKAQKDLEAKMKDLRKSADANAENLSRAERAEAELADARKQLEDLAKAGKQEALNSDPELARFQVLFEQTQGQVNQLRGLLLKIRGRDEIAAGKLKNALLALADAVRRCAE